MPALRKVSGKECLKILCNKFSFQIVRQRGSHIVLKKETPQGKVGTVIPMHPEIKIGTLRGILEQAKVSVEEFSEYV